jgi:hypothetical protein
MSMAVLRFLLGTMIGMMPVLSIGAAEGSDTAKRRTQIAVAAFESLVTDDRFEIGQLLEILTAYGMQERIREQAHIELRGDLRALAFAARPAVLSGSDARELPAPGAAPHVERVEEEAARARASSDAREFAAVLSNEDIHAVVSGTLSRISATEVLVEPFVFLSSGA